ncbi:hypothetical protein [Blastopirellula retiformator]|uniref:Uncharacterized protein n=1 Tax=Blastopirellula retiformator TaxID=2527970 RepID=A0A5C5UWH8_9BACT|nr:hypothetical protein [Blastopirellula retiformator]TWT30701.1 hypothetical protein Enr8_42240 [Blastopirellula retiformator]
MANSKEWDKFVWLAVIAAIVGLCVFGGLTCAIVSAAETHTPAVHDRVDLIEVNHLYDCGGRHVLDQIIFWDWDRDRFTVRAWRLIKDGNCLPRRNRNGVYVSYWRDMYTMRKVVAPRKRETWTNYDPEVADREVLPMDCRWGLVRCAD